MCVCVDICLGTRFAIACLLCVYICICAHTYIYIIYVISVHVHVLPPVSVCFLLHIISKSTALRRRPQCAPLELEVRRRWSQPVEASWVHNLGREWSARQGPTQKERLLSGWWERGDSDGYCIKVWKVKRIWCCVQCQYDGSWESTLSLYCLWMLWKGPVTSPGIPKLFFLLKWLPKPFSKEGCVEFLLILDGSINWDLDPRDYQWEHNLHPAPPIRRGLEKDAFGDHEKQETWPISI